MFVCVFFIIKQKRKSKRERKKVNKCRGFRVVSDNLWVHVGLVTLGFCPFYFERPHRITYLFLHTGVILISSSFSLLSGELHVMFGAGSLRSWMQDFIREKKWNLILDDASDSCYVINDWLSFSCKYLRRKRKKKQTRRLFIEGVKFMEIFERKIIT